MVSFVNPRLLVFKHHVVLAVIVGVFFYTSIVLIMFVLQLQVRNLNQLEN